MDIFNDIVELLRPGFPLVAALVFGILLLVGIKKLLNRRYDERWLRKFGQFVKVGLRLFQEDQIHDDTAQVQYFVRHGAAEKPIVVSDAEVFSVVVLSILE